MKRPTAGCINEMFSFNFVPAGNENVCGQSEVTSEQNVELKPLRIVRNNQVKGKLKKQAAEDISLFVVDKIPDAYGSYDLIPNTYGGGCKVWECSLDLVRYLNSTFSSNNTALQVMELGCGHGLPGIMMLKKGFMNVLFSDLNDDVLENVTWTNININCDNSLSGVMCISGDWSYLDQFLVREEKRFDLILSAETLYSTECCEKVFYMIRKHLSQNGIALIASKRFYFGVGGGTQALEDLCTHHSNNELCYHTVQIFEDGKSNIREIIQITKKQPPSVTNTDAII